MNTYNVAFITNSEQLHIFNQLVKARTVPEAKAEIRTVAKIPERFILSCKKV